MARATLNSRPSRWTPVLLLHLCVVASLLSLASSVDPKFDNAPYVETLYELENTAKTLVTFKCSDADGDVTIVSLATNGVSPSSPCGSCFSVLPCAADYCLIFSPVEKLNQLTTPNYKVKVECKAGTGTVSTTVDIRLTRNTPPRFDPNKSVASHTVSATKTRNAGYKIYDVNAVDDDTDTIVYSMTTSPASDNFEIGSGDGIIRAKNDLKLECRNYITLYVNITDGINDPVGPLAVHVTLDGANVAPDLNNLDKTIQVPEDTGVSNDVISMSPTDDDNTNKLTYTLTANPPSNLAFFKITNSKIQVKSALNYEPVTSRRTVLTVVASDGACTSPEHQLTVIVTDVNEAPTLLPVNMAYSVYEGSDFGPGVSFNWNVQDEDFIDTHTFAIVGGNANNMFSIDSKTGEITVNGDYDIDNNAKPNTQKLQVEVTDKGGLTDQTSVILNFKDRNDKYPVIKDGTYDYTVCEDKRVGAKLGTLTCTDDDSTFQGNNEVYFAGSTGSSISNTGGVTVLSSGVILMSTRPAVGQTLSATVYCYDRGIYPGPLRSLAPTIVSVTGVQCPTTTKTPLVVQPVVNPAVPAAATTAPATTSGGSSSWIEDNLPWIVVGALLGTALLALLLYMCCRYCWPRLATCCQDQCCRPQPYKSRRLLTPPPRKVTPVKEKPRQLKPPPPPSPSPPPTPDRVIGNPDGYLHDFWKERFPDDDYGHQPNRKANPRPITPNGLFSGSGNNALQNGGPTAPAAKKSRCTIL